MDSKKVSAMYGRIMAGILGVATVVLAQGAGVDISPEDAQAVTGAGQEVINAGYLLAAKITAAASAVLALFSKYRESLKK